MRAYIFCDVYIKKVNKIKEYIIEKPPLFEAKISLDPFFKVSQQKEFVAFLNDTNKIRMLLSYFYLIRRK